MEKVDYNIEFCHIFTNEKFGMMQRISSNVAESLIETMEERGNSYATTILIDDYLPSYSYLDIYDFLERIKGLGIPPSYIVYESHLAELAKKLINSLDEGELIKEEEEKEMKSDEDTVLLQGRQSSSISLKKEYSVELDQYIETPALIASWYLLRLGIYQREQSVKFTNYTEEKPFVGKKLFTIVPMKNKEIDEKAKLILKHSEYSNCLDNLKNLYISQDHREFPDAMENF